MTTGGLWTFVTDSTGENILWEKMTKIKYLTNEMTGVIPLSVCATPDGGFTVAGSYNCSVDNGGPNGFVAHFVPQPVTGIQNLNRSSKAQIVQSMVNGSKVIFTADNVAEPTLEITIYNAIGKTVARLSGSAKGPLVWDRSKAGKGVYFYQVKMEGRLIASSMIGGIR